MDQHEKMAERARPRREEHEQESESGTYEKEILGG